MSRIQSDAVALAADGVSGPTGSSGGYSCVTYSAEATLPFGGMGGGGPGNAQPISYPYTGPSMGGSFDPRRRLTGLAARLLSASNALYDRVDYSSGGSFAEVGTTRHWGKP